MKRHVMSDRSDENEDEREHDRSDQPLIPKKTRVYGRRWYVVFMFSVASLVQNVVWNTWGPITQSAKVVFDWSDSQIGMFANWGNIAYIIIIFPICYFMETKGLRASLLLCNALILSGSGLRCITYNPTYATWLMNIGAILNGAAGAVPFAGPAFVANIWFPPNQRTTATTVMCIFAFIGFALSFIIGSQLVSSPHYVNQTEITNISSSNIGQSLFHNVSEKNVTVLLNFDEVRSDIMKLMYYECGVAGLIFLMCLLYMPSQPPIPPSNTASMQRTEYKKGLLQIVRIKSIWLIGIAYAVPSGVYGAWGATLDVFLNPVGISQAEVGWIGFYSVIAGCIAGLVVARISDLFMKHMKLFLLFLFSASTLSFVWFTLICVKVLPFSIAQVYTSSIVGAMFLMGGIGLFFELGSESAYPISEAVVGGFLTCLNNLSGIVFLLVLLIPGIGTSWMNWALVGAVGLGILSLIVFPERYTRTDIDIHVDKSNTSDTVTEHQHVYSNNHIVNL